MLLPNFQLPSSPSSSFPDFFPLSRRRLWDGKEASSSSSSSSYFPVFVVVVLLRLLFFIGLETGPGDGDPVQGDPSGVDGWGAAGKVPGLPSPRPLRQPLSHQRVRPGAGSLPGQLHQ